MAKISKSIHINAPVEQVFGYMSEPTNLPEIWPSMIAVSDIKRTDAGIQGYHWVYKMAGVQFEGDTEITESITNQRSVSKNEKGIPSTFIWTYQSEAGGTEVNVEVEYKIPGALLGKLTEPFILKMNEREADTLLANLKARMES